ncbi:unnamed protein product [Mesocestoides corti]|uniref:Annexin n=1 Tax=Mesocestoides corti TaxID=53468 RepID=A0A0R3UAK1_MESCO|nr:unnamed protein product [Mesocestoides corti]
MFAEYWSRSTCTDEQAIIDILGQRTSAERLEIRQTFAAISQEPEGYNPPNAGVTPFTSAAGIQLHDLNGGGIQVEPGACFMSLLRHIQPVVHTSRSDKDTPNCNVRPAVQCEPLAGAQARVRMLDLKKAAASTLTHSLALLTPTHTFEGKEGWDVSSSLHDALHRCLSGDFRDLALTLTKTPWEIMAEALFNAMRGYGIKERVLNEILSSCSRDDIPELKKAYEEGKCRLGLCRS